MIIKFMLFFILLIICLTYEYSKNRKLGISKFLFVLIVLFLSIIYAKREFIFADFGTDYLSYKEWYGYFNINSSKLFGFNNIGFNLLGIIINLIFNNFYVFLFFCGLIINYCILYFIDKNSKNITLSIMIYFSIFYFNTFNIMRQWIACSVYLLFLHFVKDRKLLKYIFGCFVASTFHISALFLILLYPIVNIGKSTLKKVILMLLCGLIVIFNINYIESNFFYSNGLFLFDNYSRYLNYDSGLSNYVNFSICLLNLIVVFWMIVKSKYKLNIADNWLKLIILVFALLFSYISTLSFAFARFSLYFLPIIMLTIPDILDVFIKKDRLLIMFIIYFILLYIVVF